MTRTIAAGFAGGVIYYVAVMISWMVLPWHGQTLHNLPSTETIVPALTEANLPTGVYIYPGMTESTDAAEVQRYEQMHEQGPLALLIYQQQGGPMMPPAMMIRGLLLDVCTALLLASLLALTGPANLSYGRRVWFSLVFGVAASLCTHLAYWNWMLFPLDFTLAMCGDVVVGWLLAGCAMAAIVKPGAAT